ncbi:MAG: hypothetical protein R3E66_16380 [bacterium]
MRRVIGSFAALAVLLSATAAFAQDDVKTKFYNFDDMLIDGQLKTLGTFNAPCDKVRAPSETQKEFHAEST